MASTAPTSIAPPPSLPMKAVVTPCIRNIGIIRFFGSAEARSSPMWVCGSMKPGATIIPRASMMRRAIAWEWRLTETIWSPVIATSPTKGASDPV
ncbi:MAG: hypothetical protein WDN44_11060 [Sphingomonas sp.]